MNTRPVKVTRVIRRMAGGAQSQLVQCADDRFYVAKFLGNPQGNRTLINEWVSYNLLTELRVSSPHLRVLELPSAFQACTPDLNFLVGSRRVPLQGTLHLGSECPVNPEKTAIFDFLPPRLLPNVRNLAEFATMFVFDQWVGQVDKRQAVFVRDRTQTKDIGLRGYFVDHDMAFDGSHWKLRDQLCGVPFQSGIYASLDFHTLVEEALIKIQSIKRAIVLTAAQGVPPSWFASGDQESLAVLLNSLTQRQRTLRPLIARRLAVLEKTFNDY